MKELLLYLIFILLPPMCFSQSLKGDWKGNYTLTTAGSLSTSKEIKLRFIVNEDSSYSVFSYSGGRNSKNEDTTIICNLAGQIRTDSVYLEEVEILLPKGIPPACLQKMSLKIIKKKKITELKGSWKSESGNCNWGGTIYFWKKNEL